MHVDTKYTRIWILFFVYNKHGFVFYKKKDDDDDREEEKEE